MVYQATDKTRERQEASREGLLTAGHKWVAKQGFQSLSIAGVAASAGMATGNVYRYFKDKNELTVAIFERATQHEINAVFDSVNQTADASLQLEVLLTAFAQRALASPTLAYALIAEPVSPALEQARLRYRAAWATRFQSVIELGMEQQAFAQQPASLAAAALVGAMAETVVQQSGTLVMSNPLIDSLVQFCLRALRA